MMVRTAWSWLCVLGTVAVATTVPGMRARVYGLDIRVDGSRRTGTIRPLHGVNNGPLNCGETVDVSARYRELGIPLARLHDAEWPDPNVVDIHAVFPDPSADPERPESYRFSRTDAYIRALVKTGTGIVYRLGESIEHTRRKYHVHPPADDVKWATACLGIIRHYNEGWADGARHGIRYWEIWNEPENRPAMWTGSDKDYYRLYVTAAKVIKSRFPDLKVGGPSVGATGEVRDGRLQATPFLKGFLHHCREGGAPLDFFSWHTYSGDPSIYAIKARAIRAWLDTHGLTETEIHLNEWNYLPDGDWTPMLATERPIQRKRWYERMGGPEGAAFLAYVLIDLQDSPVDAANYYTGDTGPFGLFDRCGVPKKTYHAMKAFRMLLDTPQRIRAAGKAPGRWAVCAGASSDGHALTVLASNFRSDQTRLDLAIEPMPWSGGTRWRVWRVDEEHDLAQTSSGATSDAPVRVSAGFRAPCVVVVRLQPAEARSAER